MVLQSAEQPSSGMLLPSSHTSPKAGSIRPLPQPIMQSGAPSQVSPASFGGARPESREITMPVPPPPAEPSAAPGSPPPAAPPVVSLGAPPFRPESVAQSS